MKNIFSILVVFAISVFSFRAQGQSAKHDESRKVLFVLTNVNVAPSNGAAIGLWLEEFAAPYYILRDKGIQVTLATPKGGVSPIDLRSSSKGASTLYTERFLTDTSAQKALYHTTALKEIDPAVYDAVFYPGGRGPMWDLPEDPDSRKIIEALFNSGKPVAFVCHGPVALKNAKDKDGVLILKGRKVAGYSNAEEKVNDTAGGVPYSLENMLINAGANYQNGENFQPFVVKDGKLISGQNPHSSVRVAEEILSALGLNK